MQSPPFAPPKGRLTMEHLMVMRQASASTSSMLTFSAYLVPPLVGNLCVLCWHLYPEMV